MAAKANPALGQSAGLDGRISFAADPPKIAQNSHGAQEPCAPDGQPPVATRNGADAGSAYFSSTEEFSTGSDHRRLPRPAALFGPLWRTFCAGLAHIGGGFSATLWRILRHSPNVAAYVPLPDRLALVSLLEVAPLALAAYSSRPSANFRCGFCPHIPRLLSAPLDHGEFASHPPRAPLPPAVGSDHRRLPRPAL